MRVHLLAFLAFLLYLISSIWLEDDGGYLSNLHFGLSLLILPIIFSGKLSGRKVGDGHLFKALFLAVGLLIFLQVVSIVMGGDLVQYFGEWIFLVIVIISMLLFLLIKALSKNNHK
ncbi:hypothetical protein [Bacterioplanoides sp.]|uniref:hypothetical protein n=1 Tax=Bacterioplanoides sp. TaxID=2066072 RepID=UPI003AFFEB95